MKVRATDFQESLPLLRRLWPDSYHIMNHDDPLGLIVWRPTEYQRQLNLAYYGIEHDGRLVGTVHAFRASPEVVYLRGLVVDAGVPLAVTREMVDMAIGAASDTQTKKVCFVHKENLNNLVKDLGFDETQGPTWTIDWKVYVSWKHLNISS